jgi:DNA segregation ATPase FtsK/SpoIIIE-like protein
MMRSVTKAFVVAQMLWATIFGVAAMRSPEPLQERGTVERGPPKSESAQNKGAGGGDQNSASQEMASINSQPPEAAQAETAAQAEERHAKKNADWWIVRFTGGIFIVGLFQGLVFIVQTVVFGRQARRLRQTVKAMKGQAEDLKASVAEGARAANAMENVATHIALSAKAATESVEALKSRTAQQMRAYLAVNISSAVFQERQKTFASKRGLSSLTTG